jgi:uncharacterized membrane protein YsdA (DUF1294 family)
VRALDILSTLSNTVINSGGYYLAVISVLAVCVTVFDKLSAKAHGRRVPELTLFLLALIGGSAAMYLTMLIIRHKTRHFKFMIGLPLIILIQIALIFCLFLFA